MAGCEGRVGARAVVAGVAVVGGGARGVTGVGAGERIRRASAVVGTAGTCGAWEVLGEREQG